MKLFALILAGLGLLAILLAVSLMPRRGAPPECTGRVVMMKGPDGDPVECVCLGGTLSTCFAPGP
jgi:hypothetical protein